MRSLIFEHKIQIENIKNLAEEKKKNENLIMILNLRITELTEENKVIKDKEDRNEIKDREDKITTDIFNFKPGEILIFRTDDYGKNKKSNQLVAITNKI